MVEERHAGEHQAKQHEVDRCAKTCGRAPENERPEEQRAIAREQAQEGRPRRMSMRQGRTRLDSSGVDGCHGSSLSTRARV
jgi:hypothetical protein